MEYTEYIAECQKYKPVQYIDEYRADEVVSSLNDNGMSSEWWRIGNKSKLGNRTGWKGLDRCPWRFWPPPTWKGSGAYQGEDWMRFLERRGAVAPLAIIHPKDWWGQQWSWITSDIHTVCRQVYLPTLSWTEAKTSPSPTTQEDCSSAAQLYVKRTEHGHPLGSGKPWSCTGVLGFCYPLADSIAYEEITDSVHERFSSILWYLLEEDDPLLRRGQVSWADHYIPCLSAPVCSGSTTFGQLPISWCLEYNHCSVPGMHTREPGECGFSRCESWTLVIDIWLISESCEQSTTIFKHQQSCDAKINEGLASAVPG